MSCEIKEETKPFDRPWEAKSKELHEFAYKLTALCVEFDKFPPHQEQTTIASRLSYLARDIRQAANTVAKYEAEQERTSKVEKLITQVEKYTNLSDSTIVRATGAGGEFLMTLGDMATLRELVRIIKELRGKVDA